MFPTSDDAVSQKEVLTQQRLKQLHTSRHGPDGSGQKEVLTQQRLKQTMLTSCNYFDLSERSSNTTKIETRQRARRIRPDNRSERSSNTTKIETSHRGMSNMQRSGSERSSNTTKIETYSTVG